MKRPAEILSPDDYRNYRNVRAVAVLYIVIASLITFIGTAAVIIASSLKENSTVIAVGVVFSGLLLLLGVAGIAGGIATLRGNRKWSPLIWAVAAFYLGMFPLGTILSVIMFRGLHSYFDSIEQIRLASNPEV